MILSFVLLLNLLVLYGFFLSKKNLHVYELIVSWMVLTLLRQNFLVIIGVNLGLITVSQKLSLYWAVCFDRLLLFPVLEVWFLNAYSGTTVFFKKVLLFLLFLTLLVALEALTVKLGLMQYVRWTIWWSMLYWASSLLAGIFILKNFRKLLVHEGQL